MSSEETDGLRDGEQPPNGEVTGAGPVPPQSHDQAVDGDDQRSVPSAGGADRAAARDAEHEHEGGFWSEQHRKLEVIGTALTVVAGIVGLVFLFWPDAQPKADPEPPPRVELIDSDVDREQNVAANVIFDGQVTEQAKVSASVVSVTLRNSADNPVLITHAEVRLTSATEILCTYGGGLTDIQAQYNVKIPRGAGAGTVISRKMKYTLPPHTQERVAFTVGPERYGEGSMPWIYTFTISLHMDDGSTVTVPEVTYLAPTDMATAFLAMAEQAMSPEQPGEAGLMEPACVSKQARSIGQLVKSAPRPSPELRDFSAKLTRLAALR
ncbi:hypothetical protein [Streptomyces flaveolus]|uniref:hypothetical protein n=1 Tax=Streptomyces flaveolus TaxID=67297 RepID=UPI00369229BE